MWDVKMGFGMAAQQTPWILQFAILYNIFQQKMFFTF